MRNWLLKRWLEILFCAGVLTLSAQIVAGPTGLAEGMAALNRWFWPIVWGAHIAVISLLVVMLRP